MEEKKEIFNLENKRNIVDASRGDNTDLLEIKDEEVWTYRVEGLAAPRINKPVKYRLLKQIVFVLIIIIVVGLAIYFSVAAVQKETFEFKNTDFGVELTKFNNTGYITELFVDCYTEIKYIDGDINPVSNFYFIKDDTKPIVSIKEYAFNCDEKLETLYIGASVKEIDGKSFYSCNALERIIVDDSNPYFCDIDGVLYNKEVTELICYPINHTKYLSKSKGYGDGVEKEDENYKSYCEKVLTFKVPNTIKKIGKLAFNYTDLKIVYLPEGLKRVETMSFFRATQLSNIYSYKYDRVYNSLPEGLEFIGSDAFSYCQELDYMYIPYSVTNIGHHAFWDSVYKDNGELKGVTSINIARSKDDFKKNVDCGDQWRPKYDYLLFKKNVDTYYDVLRKPI